MSNFLKAKRLEVFVIVVIIAGIGVVYAFTRTPVKPNTSTTNPPNVSQTTSPATDITYDGMDGRNALDLLKAFHQVQTKDTSYGPEVTGIDGEVPDASNSYWAFYVNGQLSPVGADTYVTKNGDKIEWKVESF